MSKAATGTGARTKGGKNCRIRHRQTVWAINISSIILSIVVLASLGVVWNRGGIGGDYSGRDNGDPTVVQVAEGSSLSDLSEVLVEKNVVKTPDAFVAAANKTKKSDELQPGYYRLRERMSAEAAVAALLDVQNQVGTIDIPTGTRLADVRIVASSDVRKGIFTLISESTCLAEDQCIDRRELEDAAGEANLDALGVPAWARREVEARGNDPRRIEGLITPGVHHIDPMLSPEEMISTLVKESVAQYEETGLLESAKNVGLSPYELITAASLIEMESPEGDFDKVARVILNRLKEPMQLQFDSTVNYDLPEQEIATTDADRQRVTPWNTYAKDGLPETPIASPSLEAIEAIEHPADGDWLYFVTVDKEGRTVFTSNFADHEAAIAESINNGVLDSNR